MTHPFGDHAGRFDGGAGQNDGEFLAAITAEEVGWAQHAADRVGKGVQDVIAGAVSMEVVDRLEVIEVEHDDESTACRSGGSVQTGAARFPSARRGWRCR